MDLENPRQRRRFRVILGSSQDRKVPVVREESSVGLEVGARLGPYEITGTVGAGGMGEVYRARDTRLNRDVAVKILPAAFAADPERRARFEREAQSIAVLSHANILAVFDTGAHDGQVYLVTELLDGETLRERLRAGPLPVRKAIDIAGQIARGLAAAHDKGIVHRDLKPENVFVLTDGQVKLLDFGLARPMPRRESVETETVVRVTEPGTVMGTVGYMAPEQVRGIEADARADLFSLGAVIYEMLSGRRAFEGNTSADTMTAVLREDPPELSGSRPELSPALDRIVRHCLEKSPAERFQSARDVAFALESLSGSNVTSGATAVVPPARHRSWLVPGAIAGVALIAAVAGALFGRSTGSRPVEQPRFVLKTFDPMALFNARYMPDGETIVFSAAPNGNIPSLFEIRPGTLEAQPFGPPRTHLLSVSSKGELAVLTDATFINHRLFEGTLARMSVEGAPRPWMTDVREADWAPDGENVAIVHDTGGTDQLEYPAGAPLYETTGYVSDPRVSPEGGRVAFVDHQGRFDDRGWVKVVDRAGTVTTLAGEFWGIEGLAWSPDGSTLFFGAGGSLGEGAGAPVYQIQRVPADGSSASDVAISTPGNFSIHDVAPSGRWLAVRDDLRWGVRVRGAGQTDEHEIGWLDLSWAPALSADGHDVLFSDGNAGSDYSMVRRSVDGGPVTRLGDGNVIAFSPDGQWALGLRYSISELVAYSLGTKPPIHFERGPLDRIQWAAWFPDGKSLLIRGSEPDKPTRAYRQQLDGGPPVAAGPEGMVPVALSPDGKTFLALDAERRWQLIALDSGEVVPVADLNEQDAVESWSRDGRDLIVRRGNDVPARLERFEIASGRRTPFAELGPANLVGLLDLGTVAVADPERYVYGYMRRLSALYEVRRGNSAAEAR